MNDRTIVRLKITSTKLLPEDIVKQTGLNPSGTWRIGDKLSISALTHRNNGINVSSGLSEGKPLEVHLRALMRKVGPHASKIKKLRPYADVEVSCVLYHENMPPLNFGDSVIAGIAKLGASFDIDLYLGDN